MYKKILISCLALISCIALEAMHDGRRTGNFMSLANLSLAEYGQREVLEVIDAGRQSHFRQNGAIALTAFRARFPEQSAIVRYKFWGNQIVIFPRFASQECISWINRTCNSVAGSTMYMLWQDRSKSPCIAACER